MCLCVPFLTGIKPFSPSMGSEAIYPITLQILLYSLFIVFPKLSKHSSFNLRKMLSLITHFTPDYFQLMPENECSTLNEAY